MMTRPTPGERFEELLGQFVDTDGVSLPHGGSGFGRSAMRYQGKIFAMFVRGRLVVKLPALRVDELVGTGDGTHFDANKGTPMREWFAAYTECTVPWQRLATEALVFARESRHGPAREG